MGVSGVRKGTPGTKPNVSKNPENHQPNPVSSVTQSLNPNSEVIMGSNAVANSKAKLTMQDLIANPKAVASTYNQNIRRTAGNILILRSQSKSISLRSFKYHFFLSFNLNLKNVFRYRWMGLIVGSQSLSPI